MQVPPLSPIFQLDFPPLPVAISHQDLIVNAFKLQSLIIDSADVFIIYRAISSFSVKFEMLGMLEDAFDYRIMGRGPLEESHILS